MPQLATDTDRAVCNAVVDDLGQDVSALLVHASNAYGVRHIMPTDLVPPSELSERLGCLVWALSLIRCRECGAFAADGRYYCPAHSGESTAFL